jgi:hypothetical protein
MGRGLERVKRTGRDEPVQIVIYICMETTQGISLCSYLYHKLAKTSCFFNYVLHFNYYIETGINRRHLHKCT